MAEIALEAQGVSVGHRDTTVVRGVDLTLRHGELRALVGPNGAGKSTLLRALAGLRPPQSGTVRLQGRVIADWPARERAKTLGYVPQRTLLTSPLPTREVVALGRAPYRSLIGAPSAADRRAVADALERCDLLDLAERPFTQLSEGEARRVLVARALASGARVLLLDEPTAALDLRHALELFALLQDLRDDGYALLAVLHDLSEVTRHADQAIVLGDGQLRAEGPPKTSLTPELLREVWGVEVEQAPGPRFHLPGAHR